MSVHESVVIFSFKKVYIVIKNNIYILFRYVHPVEVVS